MDVIVTEVEWLNTASLTITEFSYVTGLAPFEIEELVECGLLSEAGGYAASRTLPAAKIATASRAHRVRRDFELDLRGLAVAYRLLERIDELEARLAQTGYAAAEPGRTG